MNEPAHIDSKIRVSSFQCHPACPAKGGEPVEGYLQVSIYSASTNSA